MKASPIKQGRREQNEIRLNSKRVSITESFWHLADDCDEADSKLDNPNVDVSHIRSYQRNVPNVMN